MFKRYLKIETQDASGMSHITSTCVVGVTAIKLNVHSLRWRVCVF